MYKISQQYGAHDTLCRMSMDQYYQHTLHSSQINPVIRTEGNIPAIHELFIECFAKQKKREGLSDWDKDPCETDYEAHSHRRQRSLLGFFYSRKLNSLAQRPTIELQDVS